MSHIDSVRSKVDPRFFSHLGEDCYVRILDTPHIWGKPFNESIMPAARARTKEFERAIVEIVQKSRYRCDVASLNSPDPAWVKVILGAMDTALTEKMGRTRPTQFRFLFGQTPMILKDGTSPNLIDFQGALIRMVRSRWRDWEVMPEIWMAKFYRLREGIISGLASRISSTIYGWISSGSDDDESTKMTWNHSKIIAVDGAEALVGGHNLNMDLFNSYPPVHDVSVVVHGGAAYGSQLYLNRMWECKTDLLTKEYLDVDTFVWRNGDDDAARIRRPTDPLSEEGVDDYMGESHGRLVQVHGEGVIGAPIVKRATKAAFSARTAEVSAAEIRAEDLQTLKDLDEPVFQEKKYNSYAKLPEYKKATRILSVGKYWTGSSPETDYQKASEVMKEVLIKGAKRILRLSQMDLVSAWKKKWSSHVVCHWLMDALLANKDLIVQVVVSPLDAGAGAEGDQYSFGSGACRTFELIKYYMTHDVDTDAELADAAERVRALDRLHIAPLYFTDVPKGRTIEGETYKWPNLTPAGYTATLKQPPLDERPPEKGVIGDAQEAVKMASGLVYPKVPSAPGNHAKIMIVDDESYVVGSDNLYPGFLSEFNYLVEGKAAVGELLKSYWEPLWRYSSPHCVNPACTAGCRAGARTMIRPLLSPALRPGLGLGVLGLAGLGFGGAMKYSALLGGKMGSPTLSGLSKGGIPKHLGGASSGSGVIRYPPLLNRANEGRVARVILDNPEDLEGLLEMDRESAKRGVEERQRAKESPSPMPLEVTPSPKKKEKEPEPQSNGDKLGGAHYYTDRQMYRLMRHYIGHLPNVVVLHGLSGYELRRLGPDTYRDAVPDKPVDGAPLTIVQPFNVNGNHWALLYIKVDPPIEGVRRKARVLYIDPLNPGAVPNLSPLRRVFPDLSVERCTIRYQDDGFGVGLSGGQHSCGPWIVLLAQCLASFNDVVPPAEDNPRTAAIEARAMHQEVMDKLNQVSDYL